MPKKLPSKSDDTVVVETPEAPGAPAPQLPELPPRLFKETVNQAPVAISITDDRANIVYVNRNFTEITGYAPDECIGHNESMLSDKRTPKAVYQQLWRSLTDQKPWQGCLLNRHKNGQRYLANLMIAPIIDDDGATTHYIGMHRDITDVFKLEQAVLNQKALIETVVDSIPVATVLLDESDRVVLVNQMYKTLTGDLGMPEPSRVFLDTLRNELGPEWQRLQQQRSGFRNREIRFDRGGHYAPKWFACAGSWFSCGDDSVDAFFQDARHMYFLLTLNDTTQQKRHEEELRINALRALMAEEEKNQSIRETLSGAIHHIEGPINLLSAAKTLLMRRGPEHQNSALADILDQILKAGEDSVARLKTCTPDASAGAMSPVNLNQLLHETIVLLTDRLLASGIVVDWRPTPVIPTLMGMETRLRAMLKQIIENAIDAMNYSGFDRRELRISTWHDSKLLHVAIEDTGPGIPEDLRVKVFEPFFSTKNSGAHRHSGMGLTMAQDVINQHLGLIRFDPSYKDGCRVHIQFQIQSQQAQTIRPNGHG